VYILLIVSIIDTLINLVSFIYVMEVPNSTDDLVYFTNRDLGENGTVVCWVNKEKCVQCGAGLMGKPVDAKTGKPKMRAKEYVCPSCSNTVDKNEYEDTLTANIKYTCPKCSHAGESEIPYKRKKVDKIDSLVFYCQSCDGKLLITKKMK
jgi:uncharacterized CHY-type Zn-finger protein